RSGGWVKGVGEGDGSGRLLILPCVAGWPGRDCASDIDTPAQAHVATITTLRRNSIRTSRNTILRCSISQKGLLKRQKKPRGRGSSGKQLHAIYLPAIFRSV